MKFNENSITWLAFILIPITVSIIIAIYLQCNGGVNEQNMVVIFLGGAVANVIVVFSVWFWKFNARDDM